MTDKMGAAMQELLALGVAVGTVHKPGAEPEVQEILERASRQGQSVLPLGGGTALGIMALPEKVDVVLDLTGLGDVLAFDEKNLNMTVQAGATVDSVNEFLSAQGRGFRLPLDPPWSHRATLGGVYAANASGPSRLLYGTIRDQLLGVRAVDAGGRLLNFGGLTVKNVSGYDLTKFFIGSAGRLCVITRLSLRVHPLPEAASLGEVVLEGEENLRGLLAELRASVLIPLAVVANVTTSEEGFRLRVAFEGQPEAVERQNRDFAKMTRSHGGQVVFHPGQQAVFDHLRTAVNPQEDDGAGLTLKASVPVVQGPAMCSIVRRLAGERGVEAKVALLAGNGVLYVHARGTAGDLPGFVTDVLEAAGDLQGHLAVIKALRGMQTARGTPPDPVVEHKVLRPVKEALDPQGVLLPLT